MAFRGRPRSQWRFAGIVPKHRPSLLKPCKPPFEPPRNPVMMKSKSSKTDDLSYLPLGSGPDGGGGGGGYLESNKPRYIDIKMKLWRNGKITLSIARRGESRLLLSLSSSMMKTAEKPQYHKYVMILNETLF